MRRLRVGRRAVINGRLPQWKGRSGRVTVVNDHEDPSAVLVQMDGMGGLLWVFPDQIEPEGVVDRLADLTSNEPPGFVMPGLP